MDFIKKHFEKLLLAAGLIALIGCAAYLGYRVAKLSEEVQDTPRLSRGKNKATVEATPTSIYSNALTAFQVPALWQSNAVDPFQTQFVPPPPPPPPTNLPKGLAVTLSRVIRQPFKLIFKSYTGDGENFQIDFLTGNQSFIIKKVGDRIAHRSINKTSDTGFTITKFEKKFTRVYNPSIDVTNTVDISELTIEKEDSTRILLILDKVAQEREPIAVLICTIDNQEQRLRTGGEFSCDGKTYKVIDINPTQVIIEDIQTSEKHTILPGAKE
ncbi:MAG: hypothetical protein PCFJNLEI_01570 [Verrucomicrobiae bacterium]|nr:hypothetical protein [Verrucomicrobiae bacterium]